MTELLEDTSFAEALASAFVSDVSNAPALKSQIEDGVVDAEKLQKMISKDVRSGSPLFPKVGEVIKDQAKLQAGMGQDWVASLTGAIAGVAVAATTYLAGKKVAAAQEDKANAIVQATATAKTVADQQAQLDAAKARLAPPASVGDVLTSTVAGVPVWTIPVGLAAIIGVALLLRR